MAPKMDEKWSLGRFVVMLGGLLRYQIFDETSIGKKCTGAKVFQKAKFSEARQNAWGQRGTIGGSRTEDLEED